MALAEARTFVVVRLGHPLPRLVACLDHTGDLNLVRASHGDGNLASGAAVEDVSDGGRGLAQRIGPVKDRLDLS